MIDPALKRLSDAAIDKLHRSHKLGMVRIMASFHKLKKHPGSYQKGFKPDLSKPQRMPSKHPRGFTKKAAGIFGALGKKMTIIQKLMQASKAKVMSHVRKNAKELGKELVRHAAGMAAKKVRDVVTKSRKSVNQHVAAHKESVMKHASDIKKRVDDFCKANPMKAKITKEAVRLFTKK